MFYASSFAGCDILHIARELLRHLRRLGDMVEERQICSHCDIVSCLVLHIRCAPLLGGFSKLRCSWS